MENGIENKIKKNKDFINFLIESLTVILPLFLTLSFLLANDIILDIFKNNITLGYKIIMLFYAIITFLYILKAISIFKEKKIIIIFSIYLITIYILGLVVSCILSTKLYNKYLDCKENIELKYCGNLNFEEKNK